MAIEVEKLSNGLELIMEKRKQPAVSFSIGFKSGSLSERENLRGTTHLLEHLLVKNSPTHKGRNIEEVISKTGGFFNASTSMFNMNLNGTVFTKNFPVLLKEFSEAILDVFFDEEDVKIEKQVILQELKRKKGIINLSELFFERMIPFYSVNFNFGSEKQISNFSYKKALKRRKELLFSNDMRVVAVGNFDEKKLVSYLEDSFSHLKKRKPLKNRRVVSKKPKKLILETNHFRRSGVFLSYKFSNKGNNFLINSLLKNYLSDLFFKKIREKRGLSYSMESSTMRFPANSYVGMGYFAKKEKTLLVYNLMKKEIDKVIDGKINNSLFNGLKKRKVLSNMISRSSLSSRREKIERYAKINRLSELKHKTEKISSLNPGDLIDFANEFLTDDKRYWVRVQTFDKKK